MRHGAFASKQLCVLHRADAATAGPAAAASSPLHMPASSARASASAPTTGLSGHVAATITASPFERDGHEPRFDEPLEPPARNASRDVQPLCDVVRSQRITRGANEQNGGAERGIAECVEPVHATDATTRLARRLFYL